MRKILVHIVCQVTDKMGAPTRVKFDSKSKARTKHSVLHEDETFTHLKT